MMDWTLCRARLLPKQKKRLHTEEEPEMWEHRPLKELGPTVGKRKNDENLWMIVRTWTNWNLIREPLGTNCP
jgi:hypothetical protein